MPSKGQKQTFVYGSIARNLPENLDFTIGPGTGQSGDLVAVEIQDNQRYPRVELCSGRLGYLYKGDVFIGALGGRRGTKEYCGMVPASGVKFLDKGGTDHPLALLVEAGVVGVYTSKLSGIPDPPPLHGKGLLWKDGKVLNLKDFAVAVNGPMPALPPVVMFLGTSMDVGKTTCAATCIHGLTSRGFRVAAAKLTGVAYRRDTLIFKDAGAVQILDFVDGGFPITLDKAAMPSMAKNILGRLVLDSHPDVLIVELAAGIFQPGTEALLGDDELRKAIRAVILAAADETGAIGGVHLLQERYNITPCAVVGPLCDTDSGTQYVQDSVHLPALSWRDEDRLVDLIVAQFPKPKRRKS